MEDFAINPRYCAMIGGPWKQKLDLWCIALKSSVPQGMFVCFDKEVGWCVGIAVILVVGREQ
jgi:hypothetical protein